MATKSFIDAQTAALSRYGIDAEERFIDSPIVDGRTHVLVAGEGPPVVMINGIGTPAAMWAPLMAQLSGYTLYAVDLPAYGLTDPTDNLTDDFRSTAVGFLGEVLDGLGLQRPAFVAIVLDTSAPLSMRLLSARPLGRLMMKLQPPSARQVKQLSKMVNEYPLPPEIADLVLATAQLPRFEATFLATLHTLIRLRGARPDMALTRDQLAEITQPSLLVFAADDPMGAATVGEQLAEALSDSELHIVDGGHAPWVHNAEQIAPLVSAFLGERRRT